MRRLGISLVCLAACTGGAAHDAAPPPAPSAGPTEVRVVPGAIDGRRWLAPDAARAAAAGAGPLRVLGADVVAEGERLGAFVEIPDTECALAFTRASPSVGDVDLFAYDDDGSAFTTDESPERDAAVLLCPPHPRRLYVLARVMSGAGIVGLGVQSVPREAADAVAKMAGVRGRPGEDSGRLEGWPGLAAKIGAHRGALGGKWEDHRRAAVPVSPRAPTRLSVTVEPGRCLDVLAVPSDEVGALELQAEDESARIVARGRDRGRDRTMLLCAGRAATVSLALRPRGPGGVVAVVVGRSGPGAEAEIDGRDRVTHLGPAIDLDAARAAVASLTAPLGYGPTRPIGGGTARVGARSAFAIDLPAGCARLDVLAGMPLSELGAALWDDKGALLAEARAGGSTALFTCGRGGRGRVEVEALESPGPFAVEMRRDKAAPPALVAHPVAAARLLARLGAGGEPTDAGRAAGASVVSLDEAHRVALPVPLPAAGCAEVLVALDAGAGGLDLRLVDGAGEGAVTRGRHVVSDRVCAAPNGKPATAEIRVLSGKAEALVLVR